MLGALVEWTPLIELLAVCAVILMAIIGAVWFVANGAKRCATDAMAEAGRVAEENKGIKESVTTLTKAVTDGFRDTHERLDKFIGGEE